MGRKDQEYEVESIIGKRRKKNSGSVEYRVLWKGWTKDDATWEPEEHLDNVQYMIDDFNRKIENRQKSVSHATQNQPQKKQPEETINHQESKKTTPPMRSGKKFTKESDSEFQQDEEDQQTEGTKAPIVTPTNRGRPSKIHQEQTQIKPTEKKVPPPPARNGIKPSNDATEIKKQAQKIAIETDDNEGGFSSDEDEEVILEVTGMFIAENGKYGFTVYEKKYNRRLIMRRREVIKKDPLALVRFYEKSLQPTSS